jgi:hypothetical protein
MQSACPLRAMTGHRDYSITSSTGVSKIGEIVTSGYGVTKLSTAGTTWAFTKWIERFMLSRASQRHAKRRFSVGQADGHGI